MRNLGASRVQVGLSFHSGLGQPMNAATTSLPGPVEPSSDLIDQGQKVHTSSHPAGLLDTPELTLNTGALNMFEKMICAALLQKNKKKNTQKKRENTPATHCNRL